MELGHTDTDHTTCLNVPSVGLVVAGDAAYNDVHLYLAESNAKTRREWISALDKIESLNPRAVIAAHTRFRPDSRNDYNRTGALRQDVGALSISGQSWMGTLEFGTRSQTVI